MSRHTASFSYNVLVAYLALVQASYASDAVYLAYVLNPIRFFEVFFWYYLSLALSRIAYGYLLDVVSGGYLLRASLAMQIAASALTGFSDDYVALSIGRLLRGIATSAMMVGVLEGSTHPHFRRLYGLTELAMAAGFLSAYIIPRPLAYSIYIALAALFLPIKTRGARAGFKPTISRRIVPVAISEFFLNMGLALTVPVALKISAGESLLPIALSAAVLIRALAQLIARVELGAGEIATFRLVEALLLYSLSALRGIHALLVYLVVNIIAGVYRASVGLIIRRSAERGGDLGFHYFLRDVGAFTGTVLGIYAPGTIFAAIAAAYSLSALVLVVTKPGRAAIAP